MTTRTDELVHPSNRQQLQAWDGGEGAYWTEHAEHFDRSVAAYDEHLFAAADITSAERVLDIGCGTGQTTRDAARKAVTGSALGVDLSAQMLAYARRRAEAERVTNASFLQADAQVHDFGPGGFDLAISRTGAMFFGDPAEAFANIAGALVPRGRLVLVVWQSLAANEWLREISGALAAGRELPQPPPHAPGPFALADPDRVRAVLTDGGFTDVELEGVEAGMWFGTDADDAHRFVLGLMGWMLDGLDDDQRSRAVDALRATMTAHETSDGVVFGSGAWTIRAVSAR